MTRNISTVGAVQLCQFTGSAGLNSFRPAAHGSSPRLLCELQGLNNSSAEGRKRRAALGLGKPLRQVQGAEHLAIQLTCPSRCRRQSLTRRGQQKAVVVVQYPM